MGNLIRCAKCQIILSEKELAQGYCNSCRAKEKANKEKWKQVIRALGGEQ